MASNEQGNAQDGQNGQTSSATADAATTLGPAFTQEVINSMGPKTDPRLREIMTSLIGHLHDFARDVRLTSDEWSAGVQLLNWAGQMSDDKRNEGQLICDILGLESLVDDMTYTAATRASGSLTASAILGPFYREDHPVRANGSTIAFDTPADAQVAYLYGRVTDAATGQPLAGAEVDIWQASTNGLYEQQDPDQRDSNLRGKFVADADGRYALYCLRPTPYPLPPDGPAAQMLRAMDRHFYRPAHIHLLVRAQGHKQLVTQIFDRDCKYLENDTVFAVKPELAVAFAPRTDDPQAQWELEYDIKLAAA